MRTTPHVADFVALLAFMVSGAFVAIIMFGLIFGLIQAIV